MVQTFGRLLFLFVGLLLVAVTIAILAWFGVLGLGAEALLKGLSDRVFDFYQLNKEKIDRALPLIGATGSGLWAALVFAKAWHYAHQNLPKRLEDYNERTAQQFLDKRAEVLAWVEAQSDATAHGTLWSKFTSLWQNRSMRNYCESLEGLTTELDQRLRVLEGTKRDRAIEKATAHIALGLASARAADGIEKQEGKTAVSERTKAREEFLRAADLDPEASWVLLNAAEQSKRLGLDRQAISDAESLSKAKANIPSAVQALLLQAEVWHRLGHQKNCPEWVSARKCLEEALVLLQPLATPSHLKIEIGKTYEMLGRVQASRERFSAARSAFSNAKSWFIGSQSDVSRLETLLRSISGESDTE